MRIFLSATTLLIGLLLLWQFLILIFQLPNYILPSPLAVFNAIYQNIFLLLSEAKFTLAETLLGLCFGILIGSTTAILMLLFKPIKFWFLPILLISQAIPTFAIAPLLVIWFGYGMASKIVTTIIMLFFPITTALYDGLRRTPPAFLELASSIKASRWKTLWHIQIPAAMPTFASGLRVATAIAPIGAVVGEWVGASKGLGYLMLNANARMQIDLMFAALIFIILLSLALYFSVDLFLKKFIFWKATYA